MPELTVPTRNRFVDLVPIIAVSLLLALWGAHFERQFITISAVGSVYTWPLGVAVARDVLIVLFIVACWFAASTAAKWGSNRRLVFAGGPARGHVRSAGP